MSKVLAKLTHYPAMSPSFELCGETVPPRTGVNLWECQLCEYTNQKRTMNVTGIMIHLHIQHNVNLEWQSFDGGEIKEGNIIHVHPVIGGKK